MLFKIISKIINANILSERILNTKTPKGILLLLGGAVSFGYLNENQVNFLISLYKDIDISIFDFYLLMANLIMMFMISMGLWLVFAKVKKEVNK